VIHGFALGFAFAAGVMLFRSIARRAVGRTVVVLFKTALVGVAALAAFAVVVVVLFRLIAVGNQPDPQASARAPAASWLDDK
jgi:hypothetical protein